MAFHIHKVYTYRYNCIIICLLYYRYISSKVKGSIILHESLYILEDCMPFLGTLFQPIYQESQKLPLLRGTKSKKSLTINEFWLLYKLLCYMGHMDSGENDNF